MMGNRVLPALCVAAALHVLMASTVAWATSVVHEEPWEIVEKASLVVKAQLMSRRPLSFFNEGQPEHCGYLYEADVEEWIKGSGDRRILFSSIRKVEFERGQSFLVVGFLNQEFVQDRMDNDSGKPNLEAALCTRCPDRAIEHFVGTMPLTITKFEQDRDGRQWLVFDIEDWLNPQSGWQIRKEEREGKTVQLIRWDDVSRSIRTWLGSEPPKEQKR
jgi:hypothetical protein